VTLVGLNLSQGIHFVRTWKQDASRKSENLTGRFFRKAHKRLNNVATRCVLGVQNS